MVVTHSYKKAAELRRYDARRVAARLRGEYGKKKVDYGCNAISSRIHGDFSDPTICRPRNSRNAAPRRLRETLSLSSFGRIGHVLDLRIPALATVLLEGLARILPAHRYVRIGRPIIAESCRFHNCGPHPTSTARCARVRTHY